MEATIECLLEIEFSSRTILKFTPILIRLSLEITLSSVQVSNYEKGESHSLALDTTVYNSTIEEDVFIGAGAIIGNGCYVETGAYIAPGARVPEGTTVPSGEVWVGSPATKLRDVTPQERENIAETLDEGIKLSVVHAEGTF